MGSVRRQRARIAWLALVALLGNLVLGMACSAPAKQASDYPAELLGALVICSEHGEKSLSDDGSVPTPTRPCPICSAALSFTLASVAAALIGVLPPPRGRHIAPVFTATFADRLFRGGLGSRAPPLPA
jgi:Protein of unknown function (DUF2946)